MNMSANEPKKVNAHRVNPEERAVASTRRTRRHSRGDLEVSESRPHARLIDAEHCEILGLDCVHVALVRDSKRTALEIIEPRCMHRPARKTSVAVRAWVVACLNVGSRLRRRPEGGEALVACKLRCCRLPRWKLKYIFRVWRVVDVTVHPPLVERHVLKRRDRTIVVRKRVDRDGEAVHGRMPECWSQNHRRVRDGRKGNRGGLPM